MSEKVVRIFDRKSHRTAYALTLQCYEEPVSDLCILHAQVETANEGDLEVDLPPFLEVERRIKNTKEDAEKFGAFAISLIDPR